jgi:hypothetical protein
MLPYLHNSMELWEVEGGVSYLYRSVVSMTCPYVIGGLAVKQGCRITWLEVDPLVCMIKYPCLSSHLLTAWCYSGIGIWFLYYVLAGLVTQLLSFSYVNSTITFLCYCIVSGNAHDSWWCTYTPMGGCVIHHLRYLHSLYYYPFLLPHTVDYGRAGYYALALVDRVTLQFMCDYLYVRSLYLEYCGKPSLMINLYDESCCELILLSIRTLVNACGY